ncbi:hypothetical protein V5N11_035995 [Cardamine amara subsp. amara]|uniref:Retrotransposon gag domain-containing protein n=1 Tax=Cardamine amara subsp. amara TaxID=228776 RepID=A0ABD1C215_CARAN
MGDNLDNRALVDAQAQTATQLLNMKQQLDQLLQQQQELQQQQQRGIGDTDTPHTFYQNRSAIFPPEIVRQDYEIKQMIALVKYHLFHGLPAENPMDHIENYEEICSTTKSNGVPADYIKCKIFYFSLADKALRWIRSLHARSLTTWDECRATFLDHFYTKSKTASLRNKNTTFKQHSRESFCEAWERFKEYRRDCPHQGYSDEQILNIFYDGDD